MEELPDFYALQTVEQMHTLADGLRLRIFDRLTREAMTATQLGEAMEIAPSKIHYHVRELERVGLVTLVATREKGGILEKYYRAVARSVSVPSHLLRAVPPDESLAVAGELLDIIRAEFMQALSRALQALQEPEQAREKAGLSHELLWMTDDEFSQALSQIQAIFETYKNPRGLDGERERCFALMGYLAGPPVEEQAAAPPAQTSHAAEPARRRVIAAGKVSYSRQELEQIVRRGEALDVQVLGVCSFAADVTAGLVDRAVARFRHRGVLHAPAEVRAVLKRKEV